MWKRIAAARRWRRILAASRLDPRRLQRPVEEPGQRDFILAGCPRTGTSLLTAMLHQPPNIVTVMEPWDGLRMPPAELFSSLREEIASTGELTRGRLDLDALREGRVEWQQDGERASRIEVAETFELGVKWPTFWQYLELLPTTRFLITLRDPVEVISSFRRVGGRLEQGLDYDVVFNEPMNRELIAASDDIAVRRALLYQYINSRLLPYLDKDNVFVVRYERWFSDPDRLRQEISQFLEVPFAESNVAIREERRRHEADDLIDLVREHVPVRVDLGYDV
jgi:hypothetical protein